MLKPDYNYNVNGVTVNVKIIPDGTVWKSEEKAKKAGFSKGDLYKKQQKVNKNGHPLFITVHNTKGHDGTKDEGELYTRATFNENMDSARVHFYVDANGAWQDLKAGTGMCDADRDGECEVSWHAGDGSTKDGGNMTSVSVEIIMGKSDETLNAKALDNGARLVAWLTEKHGLSVNDVVTHTYWVNKKQNKTFSDRDEQSCNLIYGKKWCPTYIFASNKKAASLANWKAFKKLISGYLEHTQPEKEDFAAGDKVRIKPETVTYANGKKIPAWVKASDLYVRSMTKDVLKVSIYKDRSYTGSIRKSDAVKAGE